MWQVTKGQQLFCIWMYSCLVLVVHDLGCITTKSSAIGLTLLTFVSRRAMSPLEVLGADGGVVVRRDDLRDGKVTTLSAPAVSLDNAARIGCFPFHGQLFSLTLLQSLQCFTRGLLNTNERPTDRSMHSRHLMIGCIFSDHHHERYIYPLDGALFSL